MYMIPGMCCFEKTVGNIKYNEIYTQGILSVQGHSLFIVWDYNHVIWDDK